MRILQLSFENINSLRGKSHIDFAAPPIGTDGLFAIIGETGVGKTTVLDAITLALFAKTPRDAKAENLMSWSSSHMSSDVVFEAKGSRYYAHYDARRARKKADGAVQQPHWEFGILDHKDNRSPIANGVSNTTILEQKIGMTFGQFRQSVLLPQGEFDAFLRAKPKDRSDLLERATGTEIYGKISAACFNKEREEFNKIKFMEAELGSVVLLTDDEAAQQTVDEQQLTEKINTEKKIVNELSAQVAALKQWQETQELLTETEIKLTNLADEKIAFSADENRLSAHQKAVPHQADLRSLKDTEEQILENQAALETTAAALETTAAALGKANIADTETTAAAEKIATEIAVNRPIWNEVRKLDTQIKEREQQQKIQRSELQKLIVLDKTDTKKLAETVTELAEVGKKSADTQTWLTDRAHWKNIEGDAATIKSQLAEIDDLIEKGDAEKETLHDLSKDIDNLTTKKKAADTTAESYVGQQKTYMDALHKIGITYPELSAHITELVGRERTERERASLLRVCIASQENYINARYDLSQQEYDIAGWVESVEINKIAAADSAKELEQQKQLTEMRETIYEQQQYLEWIAQSRNALQPNEPCLVCGATEHPHAHLSTDQTIAQTKLDFDQAKTELAAKTKEHQNATNEVVMAERSLKSSNQQYEKLKAVADANSRKLIEAAEKLPAEIINLAFTDSLERFVNDAESNAKARQAEVKKLEELRDQITKIDKQLTDIKTEQQTIEADIKLKQQEKQDIEKRQTGRKADFDKRTDSVKGQLSAYQIEDYSHRKHTELRQLIEAMLTDWQLKTSDQTALQSKSGNLEIEQKNLRTNIENLSKQIAEAKIAEAEITRNIAELTETRHQKLGNQSPDQLEQQAIAEQTAATAKQTAAQAHTQTLRLQETEHQTAIKSINDNITKDKLRVQQLHDLLQIAATTAGFDNTAAAEQAMLSVVEAEKIATRQKELHDKELSLKTNQKTNQKNLETYAKNLPENRDLEAVQQILHAQEAQQQTNNDNLATLRERIEQHEKTKRQHAGILDRIAQQRHEHQRWANLDALIGKGDKFRKFAQSLTLEQLIRCANQHLTHLSGRYLLQLDPEKTQELGLCILDTYQADNVRSTNTLSGGETFLVSLALALGLSDLMGVAANIQSLFIDEGFGTLDEQTLDIAITTLENLRAQGKTIGIISHVRELKERIGTRIVISRSSNGISQLTVEPKM